MDRYLRVGLLAASLLASQMAVAQPAQEFFKAKSIRFTVGHEPGVNQENAVLIDWHVHINDPKFIGKPW